MANGDGLAFFPGVLGSEVELTANRSGFLHIIEKRNVAKRAGNAREFGGVIGDRGCGGAAVDEEEIVIAEKRHEFGHEPRVGGGEGALMIIDARDVGHVDQHGVQYGGDFLGRHAGAKLLGLWSFIGERFHREMEHDLVAATMRFAGNLRGTRMIGEDGKSQRIVQGENGINGGGITGDIVENDSQTRARSGGRGGARGRAGFGGVVRLEQCLHRRLDPAATSERNRKRC